jgi:outer membrane protein
MKKNMLTAKKIISLSKKIFEKKNIIGAAIIIAFVMLAGNTLFSFILLNQNKTRVVYISMPKLYSGFKMKADLETRLKKIESERNKILEQMQSRVKTASIINPADSFLTPSDYQAKANKVIINSKQVAEQYSNKIWTTLNQYIKDYCQDRKISIILGADGTGTIMAADPTLDETDNILTYVNSRYHLSDMNN